MHYVILRDDDTSALTPIGSLERLYRPFHDRNLPVNLAVIPEVRTDVRTPDGRLEGYITSGEPWGQPIAPLAANRGLVDYLLSEPGYQVLLHGCHHDYLEYEDTDSLKLAEKITLGLRRLEEAEMGAPAAFVAPYDRFSRQAYCEVAARFPVISTGWFEASRLPRRWWPAYARAKLLGRPHFRAGRTALMSHPGCLLSYHRPYGEMLQRVRTAVEGSELTVLVTHWWEYFRDGVADEPFIAVLHGVAEWLSKQRDVKVVSFKDVASGAVLIR